MKGLVGGALFVGGVQWGPGPLPSLNPALYNRTEF